MIFLDTNVIVDLFGADDGASAMWSRATYRRLADRAMATNLIVVAELSVPAERRERLVDSLRAFRIEVMDLTLDGCFLAGAAFRDYRRRGGERPTILPDFLIAAHAAALGAQFVTRDRRLASYFPALTFITPETHHG